MTEKEIKLIIGGLLHDIGKVIYQTGDEKGHSKNGYDYLKDELKIEDKDILDSVRYHHVTELSSATLDKKSSAYITYIANNIASATDRRNNEAEDTAFEKTLPLQPVFNILNGNNEEKYYNPLELDTEINYPTDKKTPFDTDFYIKIKNDISECLKSCEFTSEDINSLLVVLESTTAFVPSSTSQGEPADISLYDHVKMTAAINSCIYQYMECNSIDNYEDVLYKKSKEFYDKKVFLLYSMDVSGIQNFIYTIQSKNALKSLRSRSAYLEIMMEHIIDTLLDKLNLSRANLIYAGGGHCYILLPNTTNVKSILSEYEDEINNWFVKHFDISLYIATSYVEASANSLKNIPEQSYAQLFKDLSANLSEKKLHRYSAKSILELNNRSLHERTRECKTCKRCVKVNDKGICDFCNNLIGFSKEILEKNFFVVVSKEEEHSLPLPGDYYLIAQNENSLENLILKRKNGEESSYIRTYGINKLYTGKEISTKIYVGNYHKAQHFEELAELSEGIDRIGVLRADVDNLGQTLSMGFAAENSTLSRTATLSRHLALFFKYYLNSILANAEFRFGRGNNKERNATIVYSGGDDLFIAGAWNEIIEIAVDINNKFRKYTQNTLSISAGIGIYSVGYPISRIAYEVGELEEKSKNNDGKASLTLLPDIDIQNIDGKYEVNDVYGIYKWDVFVDEVINEKYCLIKKFFDGSNERGKNFLYNLLELIRNRNDRINFARYVYLLARMEPDSDADSAIKESYHEFKNNMYNWMNNDKDCMQLKTAISLYSYKSRNLEERNGI